MQDKRDKVAVVTGGTSGIGYAIAQELISCGMRVVITGRDHGRVDRAGRRARPASIRRTR